MRRPRFAGRAAGLGQNDRPHAQVQASDAVVALGVVAGIGNNGLDVRASPGIEQHRLEGGVVGAAGGGAGGQDQMRDAGHGQRELGQAFDRLRAAAVRVGFPNCFAVLA